MKLLLCRGSDAEEMVALARELPYRYRVYSGPDGYLLELLAAPAELAGQLAERLGCAVEVWELLEEGCREAGDDA